jgi:hypothetical protein
MGNLAENEEMLQIKHSNNSFSVSKKSARGFRESEFASKLNGVRLKTCKKPTTTAHLF